MEPKLTLKCNYRQKWKFSNIRMYGSTDICSGVIYKVLKLLRITYYDVFSKITPLKKISVLIVTSAQCSSSFFSTKTLWKVNVLDRLYDHERGLDNLWKHRWYKNQCFCILSRDSGQKRVDQTLQSEQYDWQQRSVVYGMVVFWSFGQNSDLLRYIVEYELMLVST